MSGAKRLRVFIADDSRLVLERLLALLATVGGVQIVGAARTISATICGIQHLSPEVVILDFQMPGGTAIEVLKAVKQPGAAPVVILLTNETQPPYRTECARWGADYFFDKSREFEQVVAVCQQLLSAMDAAA